MINRRRFVQRSAAGLTTLAVVPGAAVVRARAATHSSMKIDLTFPKLGMKCDQRLAIELAASTGFQSVGGDTGQIAAMNERQLDDLNELRSSKGLVWGTCGLPVDFRGEEVKFAEGLQQLAAVGPKVKQLGIPRMTTWLSPSHGELTYRQNFRQHVERMKRIGAALAPFGIRLGLEYVGTQLLRFNRKHPFVHTSAEVLELIAETGADNLGLILDSWHWWTSGESTGDLKGLKPSQIVSVELNDAPEGIAREQQLDGQRRLPATTGVLPLKEFLTSVAATGFAGPVMAEPFFAPLREGSVEAAAEQVGVALKRSMALIQ
ncbi:MAG TPA: xylose isomerase [Verrucomicrobiales bacterium]|nr:xylose isomerase [Verrucomicrobiales bacterium]